MKDIIQLKTRKDGNGEKWWCTTDGFYFLCHSGFRRLFPYIRWSESATIELEVSDSASSPLQRIIGVLKGGSGSFQSVLWNHDGELTDRMAGALREYLSRLALPANKEHFLFIKASLTK